MPPKKGKKGKKGKKLPALGSDPDEYKSFNVAQREILQQLFAKMRRNKDENDAARNDLKDTVSAKEKQNHEIVSSHPCCLLHLELPKMAIFLFYFLKKSSQSACSQ